MPPLRLPDLQRRLRVWNGEEYEWGKIRLVPYATERCGALCRHSKQSMPMPVPITANAHANAMPDAFAKASIQAERLEWEGV